MNDKKKLEFLIGCVADEGSIIFEMLDNILDGMEVDTDEFHNELDYGSLQCDIVDLLTDRFYSYGMRCDDDGNIYKAQR